MTVVSPGARLRGRGHEAFDPGELVEILVDAGAEEGVINRD